MRLIQQKPAFSLHAFLRFSDLKYTSEYIPASTSLGRQLPLIVKETLVSSEDEIFASTEDDKRSNAYSCDAVLSSALKKNVVDVLHQMARKNGDDKENIFKATPLGLSFVYCRHLDAQSAVNSDR